MGKKLRSSATPTWHKSSTKCKLVSPEPLAWSGRPAGIDLTAVAVVCEIASNIHEPARKRTQPVQFSTKKHVGDAGLIAGYCHPAWNIGDLREFSDETCMNCQSVRLIIRIPEPVRDELRTDRIDSLYKVTASGLRYLNHSIHIIRGIGCSRDTAEVTRCRDACRLTLNMEMVLDATGIAQIFAEGSDFNMTGRRRETGKSGAATCSGVQGAKPRPKLTAADVSR